MKPTLIFPLLLCLILFCEIFSFASASPERKNFVSIGIHLDDCYGFEELNSYLSSLNFHNLTFIVWWHGSNPDYWLGNLTRLNVLKTYGNFIFRFPYPQIYNLNDRKNFVDNITYHVRTWFNDPNYPINLYNFAPDSFTIHYAYKNYNLTYVVGYCFDQYKIDHITELGGWQLPYYASFTHILRPSNGKSAIVFPHLTWDWINSFEYSHHLNTHPYNVFQYYRDVGKAKNYWLRLIDNSLLATEPFGFVSVQFEFCWMLNEGFADECFEWLSTLLNNPLYDFWSYNDVANWFMSNFDVNPIYTVNFFSPMFNSHVEWYWSNEKRICRFNGKILSYVDYTINEIDPYRTKTQTIDWTSGWLNNPDNCVDISLYSCIKIDALGGGELRYHPQQNGVPYSGKLSDFIYPIPPSNSVWYQNPITFAIIILGIALALCYLIKCSGKRKGN